MSVGPLVPPPPARRRGADALLDGAAAGAVGAIVLVLTAVAHDLAGQRELPGFVWTPAGAIERLVRAGGAIAPPGAAWSGPAFLLAACVVLGAAVAWLLARLRHAPAVGLTLTASFAALQIAFFALDRATGAGLLSRPGPAWVLTANALAAGAMTLTLWLRRPRLTEGRRDLWDDEP